jgi:RsiW-degrading membrane proteinase PrsW (M82 family)
MEIRELIIYLCIVLPMIPILFALRDKFSRRFLLFSIVGLSICLVSAQINTLLIEKIGMDTLNYSITISPINEEILKAIPLIIFTLAFAKKGDQIIPLAFAIGIGFGILENIIIYCNNMSMLTISWAIIRGIGASLMHSACTAMIAMGFSYVFNNNKSHLEGIIGLFALAILYHATFNAFVQSDYRIVALIMPVLLFIPINIIEYKKKKYFEHLEEEKN